MKRSEHIEKELAEISPALAASGNTLPYHLPENYFESFPAKMLDLIREAEQTFSQPAAEEILSLSPLLASLQNRETLQAPDGYFGQLAENTVNTLQQQPGKPAKVISINQGAVKPWIKYAIAVAVAGFIGITTLLIWNNHTAGNNQLLADTKSLHAEGLEMPQLSEKMLADYLSELPANEYNQVIDSTDADFYDIALLKVDDAKLTSILENVPEEELANYESNDL
ncbi:MAG: hypothetical protein KF862_03100 [Chitinophagaceae bacterium]|nr:hypothetical protein [Chitinophagaceae bacterium]